MAPVMAGGPAPSPTPYSTVADLREVLAPDGSTDASTAASMSDDALTDAIVEASAEIDAELAGAYSVPLDPPPPIVVAVARDIAAYLATLTHRGGVPFGKDDPVRLRGDHARALLRRVGDGKATLPGADGPVASAAGPVVANPRGLPLWDLATFELGDRPGGG